MVEGASVGEWRSRIWQARGWRGCRCWVKVMDGLDAVHSGTACVVGGGDGQRVWWRQRDGCGGRLGGVVAGGMWVLVV